MRRGRWRAGCGASFEAAESSTWVPDTVCSPRSCCCSTTRRRDALVVDKALPASTGKLYEALVQVWPRLAGRVAFVQSAIDDVDIHSTDVVVSSHACGALTDLVLNLAVAARARVAVLPCCHDLAAGDAGGLSGWVDGPVAIDIVRAMRLTQRGYRIWTQAIPADITPKNRLLLGAPETDGA